MILLTKGRRYFSLMIIMIYEEVKILNDDV